MAGAGGKRVEGGTVLCLNGAPVCLAEALQGAEDTFTLLEEGVFRWTRRTKQPLTEMCMRLCPLESMRYGMVPAVSYQGNDWGAKLDYVGFIDQETGLPWRWAYHRVSIPGATYSEGASFGVAMYLDAGQTDASCSLYPGNGKAVHEMLWPIQEGPRVYHQKHDWRAATCATIPPHDTFSVLVVLSAVGAPRSGWKKLLSLAWKRSSQNVSPTFSNSSLWDLGIQYAKLLYSEEPDGFAGFNIGLAWEKDAFCKRSQNKYEIGWCGQNASYANALLYHGLTHADTDAVSMGIRVLDAWMAARLPCGLMKTHYDDNAYTQGFAKTVDACNLGMAALQMMEAFDLARQAGMNRPEYLASARAICDFAVSVMGLDGRLGKSWLEADLSPAVREGTVGAYLTMALAAGADRFSSQDYLAAAQKSYQYYIRELNDQGFTTAGALDIYCVDKESAIPLLKAGLMLFGATKSPGYLEAACRAAWYLSTWQWHYSRVYPKGSLLSKLHYNTFGGTAVSTTHQHQDPFGLYYVPDLVELALYTGDETWSQRAQAIWRNGQQCVSDGTLIVADKLRPAGSQDEGMAYTEWGPVNEPTQWLVAWPGAFRLEVLRKMRMAQGEKKAAYDAWIC
ncbi:MAG: hypothetical protein LLF96_08280 [Eubacteriales bacterium]|nr:hypothetical protein [Eubacteriales bacterium]